MKRPRKMKISLPILGIALGCGMNAYAQPTAEQVAKLVAQDGEAEDLFGFAVAVDGDTAIVGSRSAGNAGSAYVFTRDSPDTWSQKEKLVATDGGPSDQFGSAVSIHGDTAVVGSPGDDDNGSDTGSAYIFSRNSTGQWTQQQKLTAAGGATSDQFGSSVAIDGDTVIIGAVLGDGKTPNSGSTYVFTRDSPDTWTPEAKLAATDGETGDRFGSSIAIHGGTAVIGAPGDNDNGSNSGSAYVFSRGTTGTWDQQTKLTASDGEGSDQFGFSVAVDVDTAVIGSPGDDDSGGNSGSAYVFSRNSAGTWDQQEKLTASDGGTSDQFGFSVSVDGDTAIVGSPRDDDNGLDSGSARVFTRSGSSWTEGLKLLPEDGAGLDFFSFGFSGVDVSGDIAVGGAPFHDPQAVTNAGAAYVFRLLRDDAGPRTANLAAKPNPVAANTAFTVFATVDDTDTGGSTIARADYTLNGGLPNAMAAADDAFDEVVENVTALNYGLPAGVYEFCVNGTDSADNVGAASCAFLAVYDPTGGFVTGGGWINSPAGAYIANPALGGKASFGFVARFRKGQTVPEGNTEFQFKSGDLNFRSTDYEWLVVAGAKAIFKGSGTINNAGHYGFQLSAIDGALTPSREADAFRMKIWDKNDGGSVVYDNNIGNADNADPTTAVGGGSIVIHAPERK